MSELQPYDAVFLSLAVGLFLARPRWWWLAGIAPAVALAAHWMFLGRIATPVAAIAACLLVPKYAPVALVLAVPVYEHPLDAFRATLLWLIVSALMQGLEDRIGDDVLPSPWRRLLAQLLSVAALYFTLLPVKYL